MATLVLHLRQRPRWLGGAFRRRPPFCLLSRFTDRGGCARLSVSRETLTGEPRFACRGAGEAGPSKMMRGPKTPNHVQPATPTRVRQRPRTTPDVERKEGHEEPGRPVNGEDGLYLSQHGDSGAETRRELEAVAPASCLGTCYFSFLNKRPGFPAIQTQAMPPLLPCSQVWPRDHIPADGRRLPGSVLDEWGGGRLTPLFFCQPG